MKSNFFYLILFFYTFLACNSSCYPMQLQPPKSVKMEYNPHNTLEFPHNFLKGFALSCYQNSGSVQAINNWDVWQTAQVRFNAQHHKLYSSSPIAKSHVVNASSSIYKNPEIYIKALKDTGCNALRISVEWAEIQPLEDTYSSTTLTWYKDFCMQLRKQGITPMITLYHFTLPQWFVDKGGFLVHRNITDFVEYCKVVVGALADSVELYCTINEPGAVSACSYILGIHPVGQLGALNNAAVNLKHLLQAHVAVYKTIKTLYPKIMIGLAHNPLIFESYKYYKDTSYEFTDPISSVVAHAMTYFCANNVIMKFFADGVQPLDFWGLNFYSNIVVKGIGTTCHEHDIKSDNHYSVQAKEFYQTLKQLSVTSKPIYVTENGIADSKDSSRRALLRAYLTVLHNVITIDKFDVRGYFHWTLVDNFEWHEGYTKQFGMFSADVCADSLRFIKRPSADLYKKILKIKKSDD